MAKNKIIEVKGLAITIAEVNDEKFISLTDMLRAKD